MFSIVRQWGEMCKKVPERGGESQKRKLALFCLLCGSECVNVSVCACAEANSAMDVRKRQGRVNVRNMGSAWGTKNRRTRNGRALYILFYPSSPPFPSLCLIPRLNEE